MLCFCMRQIAQRTNLSTQIRSIGLRSRLNFNDHEPDSNLTKIDSNSDSGSHQSLFQIKFVKLYFMDGIEQ